MTEPNPKDWKKVREADDALAQADAESAPASAGALDHPDYLALEEKLTQAEQTAHEHWEKCMRAMAELDNIRRRTEREVANAHRYGLEKLISALLPVLDSLEQAHDIAVRESHDAMREGLELTLKLFTDTLEKFETTPINPQGEPFNPQEHEAMAMQDSPDCAPNTVMMVFQKGYRLSDRVIRPARVIVSKGA